MQYKIYRHANRRMRRESEKHGFLSMVNITKSKIFRMEK